MKAYGIYCVWKDMNHDWQETLIDDKIFLNKTKAETECSKMHSRYNRYEVNEINIIE